MTSDNLIGIALGIMSLVIAAIIFAGGAAEVRRAERLYQDRLATQRGGGTV